MATVLIVEDEDSLRETLSRFLVHEGHEVIAAASGYEALEAGFGAAPDVLIADWMLKNHIHGLHVSEVFRGIHPDLNTILITGFPSRDLLEESDRCGVSKLLEKPFDLQDIQEALYSALHRGRIEDGIGSPIAAVAIGDEGELLYASPEATALLESVGIPKDAVHMDAVLKGDPLALLRKAQAGWVEVMPLTGSGKGWLVRSRRRTGTAGWLAVLCPCEEEQRRNDPRVRILLDVRGAMSTRSLADHGPIVVIERDGVVRRLLVSQIERVGAICYPSDDLPSAIRLLKAEPSAATVLVDFTLAGQDMQSWVAQIRRARPKVAIVGTGGVGSEADLLAQGVGKVLRKPWRINDLLDAIEGRPHS